MHEQTTAHALLSLYSQVATLKLLPRTGWLQRGVANAESVAEHTFGVLALTLFIGDQIAGLDHGKLLAIALLHDMAEVYLSDLPASARRFIGSTSKHAAEQRAVQELFAELPNRADYLTLWGEYNAGSSPEARLVKGIDRIELLAQALRYERSGNRDLAEFWADAEHGWNDEFPLLRVMATQLLASRPPIR
jgi:putative hydrolase of HD superfamily